MLEKVIKVECHDYTGAAARVPQIGDVWEVEGIDYEVLCITGVLYRGEEYFFTCSVKIAEDPEADFTERESRANERALEIMQEELDHDSNKRNTL